MSPEGSARETARPQNCRVGTQVTLTRRAQEVAELVALGLSNREIAGRLYLRAYCRVAFRTDSQQARLHVPQPGRGMGGAFNP